MKTIPTLILLAVLAAGQLFAADDARGTGPAPATEAIAPVPAAEATTAGDRADAPAAEAAEPVTVLCTNGEAGLRLNFRGVPLERCLNYLSEAAGFIIVLDTQAARQGGRVEQHAADQGRGGGPAELRAEQERLAAIRNGRTLTIVNKDEAKTKNIPVKQGSDPDGIPNNDEIVTQIIPVRFVEVAQLIKDLQPLVATATTMTANEAGNSIVITDTQANIHRVAEIIQAIDQGAEDMTEVEVFRLQYADPTEMATLLTSVFPDESRVQRQPIAGAVWRARRRIRRALRRRGGRGGGSNAASGGDVRTHASRNAPASLPCRTRAPSP